MPGHRGPRSGRAAVAVLFTALGAGGWWVTTHAADARLGSGTGDVLARAHSGAATAPPLRIFTVAGTGDERGPLGDGGPATDATIGPTDVAALPQGGFLIADRLAHRVRRVGVDGRIATIAGTGVLGSSGDGGPATKARLRGPTAVAALPRGGFVVVDDAAHRVRYVNAHGTISTVAGTGRRGFSGDGGPATKARLDDPREVAALPGGGFLVVDGGNDRVRRVSSDGIIDTVAGTGEVGFSGDGGPATSANLSDPRDVAVAPDGSFVIADSGNHRVRRVGAGGVITTVVAGFPPSAVQVLPDETLVVQDALAPQLTRIDAGRLETFAAGDGRFLFSSEIGSGWGRSAGPGAMAFETGDGGPAARGLFVNGFFDALGVLPDGSLLVVEDARVRLVARRSSQVLGLALRNPGLARPRATLYATRLSLSGPARVRLEVRREGRRLAQRSLIVRHAGWVRAELHGSFPVGIYTVRVTATQRGATSTVQDHRAVLGGVLLDRWVRHVIRADRRPSGLRDSESPDQTIYRTRRCRRFSRWRVDCELEGTDTYGSPPYACRFVAQIVLRPNGQIYGPSYRCPTRRRPGLFKRHPELAGSSPFDLRRLR